MPVLAAQSLRKTFGDRVVLGNTSVTIEAGERLGLVGPNGSGKSTLARILAGLDRPDEGEVTAERGATLAYLAQEPAMDPARSPVEVVLDGLSAWSEAAARHDRATAQLATGEGDLDALLATQARAAAEVERLGGWDLRYQAEAMLGHLGITALERPVGTMSGGERRRVAMARLLVSRPDVAILDEPTNHLDIPTIEWLEQFLIERFTGALLLITHDRYLLDRVVTRTLELDRGELYSYEGGWEAYLTAHAERVAQAERVEANRQNFLRRELEWLRRQPKARTGKQKARIDRANQAIGADAPAQDRRAAIAVSAVRSGKTVLELRALVLELGGKRLVDGLTLSLGKGDRVGIIGPNGAGKTSLVRALLGELPPSGGELQLGQNTRVAYLDQTRAGLDADSTIFDSVADGRTRIEVGDQSLEVRTYLQRFLFDVPAQKQKVGTLSGGERARVALARVLSEPANLVILDEPTNDLDVTTLAALEASLLDFGGTALVVTHDRWFLDRVASSILSFEGDGRVVHVHGTYGDYLTWRERDRAARAAEAAPAAARVAAPAPKQAEPAPAASGPKPLTYGERIELEGLMERIDAAEAEVAALEQGLADPSFGQRDYKEQAAYAEELAAARARAEALVERWSELEARRG